MNSKDIKPIFLLGLNRNGTTWLGNTLSDQFSIATAKHPFHYGVVESTIYANYCYFGKFETINKYLEFLEVYCQSDFFQILGDSKEYYYHLKFDSFFDFFLELMDRYALRTNSALWLTKLDPYLILDKKAWNEFISLVEKRYEFPLFIGIQRNFDDYMNSAIVLQNKSLTSRARWKKNFLAIVNTSVYIQAYDLIKRFLEPKSLLVTFEQLKSNHEVTLQSIQQHYDFPKAATEQIFLKNSSFDSVKRKTNKKYGILHFILKYSGLSSLIIPIVLYRYKKSPVASPMWWKLKKVRYFRNQFLEELNGLQQHELIELIKKNNN